VQTNSAKMARYSASIFLYVNDRFLYKRTSRQVTEKDRNWQDSSIHCHPFGVDFAVGLSKWSKDGMHPAENLYFIADCLIAR